MGDGLIHPTAIVDATARLGDNVSVGPGCCVGKNAVLGDGCILHNHVTIGPRTICGAQNEFYPGAVVGMPPQDLKYRGGDTRVEMGDDNVFREYVTVHAGTEVAGGVTRIGSHNRFLVGVHLAHDCTIGNDCILSNQVQLAGHVRLEDRVTMGGVTAVHHFTTVGTLSFVGGLSRIIADVPPYMIVEGNPGQVRGFNATGMKRWGMPEERIRSLREAWKALFGTRAERGGAPMIKRLDELESRGEVNGEVAYLCRSVRRSLQEGVYGRYLESIRHDTDADRRAFYRQDRSQGSPCVE